MLKLKFAPKVNKLFNKSMILEENMFYSEIPRLGTSSNLRNYTASKNLIAK